METKVCKECRRELPIDHFKFYNKQKKSRRPECNECTKRYAREYRQSRRNYVAKIKMSRGCEVCGFKAEHPCQLDLHHVDPSLKTYKGSHKSYDAGWSLERIDEEITKCVVICKNCHVLEGYKRGHWKNIHTDISMRQSSAQ